MRKLLFIPLFFLLSLTVSTWALKFTVDPDQSQLSQQINEASSISRDRVSQITSDIVRDKFNGSLIDTDSLDVDGAIAESDAAQSIGNLSDNAVTDWLTSQADNIDVSALSDTASQLSSDALSAVREKVEELPPCQVDTEFAGLENANCNPGAFELDQEIARLSQDLLSTGTDNSETVEPPLWMQAISQIYQLSNGSAANILLLITVAWAGLIVLSYGNPLKGLGGLGKGLMWQAVLIAVGALLSLLVSSFLLRLFGLDSLVESLTVLSGVKIWQSWQSAVLVIAGGLFVISLGLRLLSHLRISKHKAKERRSHTGRVVHQEPEAPVLDQQLDEVDAELGETALPPRRPRQTQTRRPATKNTSRTRRSAPKKIQ